MHVLHASPRQLRILAVSGSPNVCVVQGGRRCQRKLLPSDHGHVDDYATSVVSFPRGFYEVSSLPPGNPLSLLLES